MIQFDIITIFPNIFNSYLEESLIKKAQDKNLIKINIHDLRKWTNDKRRTVDDRPFGGGLGMVLRIEPIYKAVQSLKSQIPNPKFQTNSKSKVPKSKTILFSPRGKKFNQKMAYRFSKLDRLIMICGRYEGVDERVSKYIADETISIGEYDLMGGEIPAMAVLESVSRLIPGVIGKKEILKERITKEGAFIEYPQYTRPEIFSPGKKKKWKVPKVLISGHHKKIEKWREKNHKAIEK